MIGVGLDLVAINRFSSFHTFTHKKLQRIFSPSEITYALQVPCKSSERFAARFAAKEALYKALSVALGKPPCPFLTLCKYTWIQCAPLPKFHINWQKLGLPTFTVLLSISHTHEYAQCIVYIFDK